MTATATTSTWQSPTGDPQSRPSRIPTTPRGYMPASVGQAMPPHMSPSHSRSVLPRGPQSPGPGYFGLAVNDESVPAESNPGNHTRQNWVYTNSSRDSNKTSPTHQSHESDPSLEAFRRQSEAYGFHLNRSLTTLHQPSTDSPTKSPIATSDVHSPISPHSNIPPRAGRIDTSHNDQLERGRGSLFNLPGRESPIQMSPPPPSVADHKHARLSLPASELKGPLAALQKQRSDTAPVSKDKNPKMIPPAEIVKYLELPRDDVLILDLRVYQQYAMNRVEGSLNLCIPTTLLKRPTFTVQKLADTFTSDHDRSRFAKWKTCRYIVVYDANSALVKDATMPISVLKKFDALGWSGEGLVIKGGYQAFQKACPGYVDSQPVGQGKGASTQPVSVSATSQHQVPIAGGCAMPATKSAANPFFGNIRQNMDLLDGVGQMPIKKPSNLSEKDEKALPAWLRKATGASDEGKEVSTKFLKIERSEQKRMQEALSGEVHYGSPSKEQPDQVQVAGIEKGSKNRYNNIFPYDHSRVKLQGVPSDGCDYVNASFVKATYSNRRYIATQAPIPATFDDFWRVVWEQDVRVIVMLTAESEGGQVKSHAYWKAGQYGPLKLKALSERQTLLDKSKKESTTRPTLGARRSTQPHTFGEKKTASEHQSLVPDVPSATVRHFTLSHSAHPFQPMREITQLQYTQWPDFGAPASPTAIIGLIDLVNKYVHNSSGSGVDASLAKGAQAGQRPIVVHCSAGCGRTGTFCTVDSVIDMLKQQQSERANKGGMDIDVPDDWLIRDDIDLVAKAVNDFRHQRLSMVQNLRQFVLCYESILQWIVTLQRNEGRQSLGNRGRSYQGFMG